MSRAAREFTPDLVEPFPQLCSEPNDFLRLHLGAHCFLNGYRKYNFEKAETSLGGRDGRQQLIKTGVGFHFKSLWETEFEMITKCQVLKLVFKMLVNIIYVFNFVK